MDYLGLVLRWLHVLSVIALVGGTYFWRLAVVPALTEFGTEDREKLIRSLSRNWSRMVMITSALILVSGLVNFIRMNRQFEFSGTPYHALFGVKFLLAMTVFWIAARLSGRSESATRFRQRITMWLTINAILATLLVCIGGMMKMTPHVRPTDATMTSASASTDMPWKGSSNDGQEG